MVSFFLRQILEMFGQESFSLLSFIFFSLSLSLSFLRHFLFFSFIFSFSKFSFVAFIFPFQQFSFFFPIASPSFPFILSTFIFLPPPPLYLSPYLYLLLTYFSLLSPHHLHSFPPSGRKQGGKMQENFPSSEKRP